MRLPLMVAARAIEGLLVILASLAFARQPKAGKANEHTPTLMTMINETRPVP